MRLQYIDSIRGILCAWVVLFHYTYRYKLLFPLDVVDIPYGGPVGITLFFFISAIFTCKSSRKFGTFGGPKWFALKLLRLYPSYICSLILIFVILTIFHLPGRSDFSFIDLIANSIMLPLFKGNLMMDTAHWYLFALIKFYIFVYTLYRLNILCNFYFYLTALPLSVFLETSAPDWVSFHLLFNGHLLPLMTAMCFYNMQNNCDNKRKWLFLNFGYIFAVAYSEGVELGIAVLFLEAILSINKLQSLIDIPIFVRLGGISYAWYLIHQNIGYAIIFNLHNIVNDYISIFLAIIITITMAFLTTKYVEKPVLSFIDAKLS